MRKISVILPACVVVLSISATACLPTISSTGGSSTAALGPDGVERTLADMEQDNPTFIARMKSGVMWLWASYTALKAKGATPGMDDLKNDIVDMESLLSRGKVQAAMWLYSRARDRVTAIAGEVAK